MSGSIYGTIFRVSTWGESHGKGLGVVVDGCPAGIPLTEGDIQKCLDRRKPGQNKFVTPRKEDDAVEILSGVFEGKTTGTPISMLVYNKCQRSADYSEIASYYRPGHADYTYNEKYGFRDYRGGGRSSGRETIGRVAAGAVAKKLLASLGIDIFAYSRKIGGIEIVEENFNREEILNNPVCMPDAKAAKKVEQLLEEKIKEHDSVGGVVECHITGIPSGIGEPVFEKLSANLGKAILSIGAVKGFEIGDGFAVADAFGSTNNDSFYYKEEGSKVLEKSSNHGGGIYGGISDGSEICFRAAVKPTPSIAKLQKTVNKEGKNIEVSIKGRHDPIIVPRAVVVVESMAAITVADMLLVSMSARMDKIAQFFGREQCFMEILNKEENL